MKKTENEWMKLMMLVMEYVQLQNELTKLRIEAFNEWEHLELNCNDCFAQAVEAVSYTHLTLPTTLVV